MACASARNGCIYQFICIYAYIYGRFGATKIMDASALQNLLSTSRTPFFMPIVWENERTKCKWQSAILHMHTICAFHSFNFVSRKLCAYFKFFFFQDSCRNHRTVASVEFRSMLMFFSFFIQLYVFKKPSCPLRATYLCKPNQPLLLPQCHPCATLLTLFANDAYTSTLFVASLHHS